MQAQFYLVLTELESNTRKPHPCLNNLVRPKSFERISEHFEGYEFNKKDLLDSFYDQDAEKLMLCLKIMSGGNVENFEEVDFPDPAGMENWFVNLTL